MGEEPRQLPQPQIDDIFSRVYTLQQLASKFVAHICLYLSIV